MLLPHEPGQTFVSKEWGERGATWLPVISHKGQYSICPALSLEHMPLAASQHVMRKARHMKMSHVSVVADSPQPWHLPPEAADSIGRKQGIPLCPGKFQPTETMSSNQ